MHLADDLHEMPILFSLQNNEKKNRMSFAAILFITLKFHTAG